MPGQPITSEAWQQYYVYADQQKISQQIYWTESDIQPHERILGNGKAALDADALPDLKALGFASRDLDAGKVFELWYRPKLTCNGANVSIKFQIAKAFSKLHDGNGSFVPQGEVELTGGEIHEVMASSHNPIPRTTPS
ncbi:hypothetical protein LTR49_027335 [Elasticomyces elasticus]|nr:hypothetical protein LTR49_027335 [Elasticomyces elasticus]